MGERNAPILDSRAKVGFSLLSDMSEECSIYVLSGSEGGGVQFLEVFGVRMGHNVSKRKALGQALGLPLGVFAKSQSVLEASCGSCRAARSILISQLAQKHGGDLLIGALLRRLRCRKCGEQAYSVKLKKDAGLVQGIVLKGPGAY